MDPKSRKALSWSISVIVHATLAFFIGRAALNYVLPEGVVDTNSTTIDVVGGEKVGPQPQKIEVAAPPIKSQSKTTSKTHVAADKDAEAPTKFMPDKNFNEIKPTDRESEPEDKAEEVAKKEDPAKKSEPELLPEKTKEIENEEQAAENTENIPQPIPKVEAAEATPGQAKQIPTELPVAKNQSQEAEKSGDGSSVPAFGTPGTTLDISKLSEMAGNQSPEYPTMAKLLHHQGTVYLRAYIHRDGHVDLPILEKSSGSSYLDREALRAFARWKFQPGPQGWVVKPIIFRLKK